MTGSDSTRPVHAALLLAAGRSKRLGRPKQFLDWNGKPLIRHIAEIILKTKPHSFMVITGRNHEKIQAILADLPLQCHYNPQWQTGMASSLKTGYEILKAEPNWRSVLITACDQPFLTERHLQNLLHHRPNKPDDKTDSIITAYSPASREEKAGIPACLGRAMFDFVTNLEGEQGFRQLWTQPSLHRPATLLAPEMEADIDTEEDYRCLLHTIQKPDSS